MLHLRRVRALSSLALPGRVRVVEMGPRDGLQNERSLVPTETKVELINLLAKTGLRSIEATSFVSPKWVPQMGDNTKVMELIDRPPGVVFPVLTPNLKGFQQAVQAKATEVAIFASASETFSQRNINCGIMESIKRFEPLMEEAKKLAIPVRGYVSCVAGCPYEGKVDPEVVSRVAKILVDMGCFEISLGDTIGVGTPGSIRRMLQVVKRSVPENLLAGHFHDTYGQGLTNIYVALEEGLTVFDSSVAGLGGCPYAKGATGNVATEDVVYMMDGLGIETGINLDALVDAGEFISHSIGKRNNSRVATAMIAKRGSDNNL